MSARQYAAITTGSNLTPLTHEVRDRFGTAIDFTGATITVLVKDELTGETIVAAGAGAVSAYPRQVEFSFADVDVAKITYATTWLVEWTIVLAGKTYRSAQYKLPVRPKL